MGRARSFAFAQNELRRRPGVRLPQSFNLGVLRLPVGDRRSPVAEEDILLGGAAHLRRDAQHVANGGRHDLFRGGAAGDRQAEPAEVVGLVVVAVPAAVVLGQAKRDPGSGRVVDRLLGNEDGRSRHVAAPGTDVDAPGRQLVAIDRIADRSRHPLLVRLVGEHLIEFCLRRVGVGQGLHELDPDRLLPRRLNVDEELRQRTEAVDGPTRAAHRQVRVVQVLEAEGFDLRDVCNRAAKVEGPFCGRVTLGEDRAVVKQVMLLAAGGVELRACDRPCGFGRQLLFPGGDPFLPVGTLVFQVRFDLGHLAQDLGPFSELRRRIDGPAAFGAVVEIREQAVVVGL